MTIQLTIWLMFGVSMSANDSAVVPLTNEQLTHHTVKVAAVQMSGNWIWQGNDDMPKKTAETVVNYIDRAGSQGIDIIAFPELLLGKFRVPCVITDKIGEAAARNKLYVLVGCFEIINDEGDYRNTILLFDRSGRIQGRFSKMHPAVGEPPFLWPATMDDPEGCMIPGKELPVFDLDFGRIGIYTCYDGYFPELPRILSLKGAEVLFWINARGGGIEDFLLKADSFRNHVHIVATNKAVGSGTSIVEYPGRILASVDQPREDFITAELALTPLRFGRKYAREFFQREPNLYKDICGDYPVWKYYDNLVDPSDFPKNCEVRGIPVDHPIMPAAGMADGTPLSPLAAELRAPWMQGWVEFRFAETISSPLGFHFIDHYKNDSRQLSPLDPWPKWIHDERSGGWSYEFRTKEGLVFQGSLRPYRDAVFLEFKVHNETGTDLAWVDINPCLRLGSAPEFNYPYEMQKIYVRVNNAWMPLSETTPTPEQMGRNPWVIMRCQESLVPYAGPKEQPNLWLLDQVADVNLIAAESKDGKYLIGYAWDTAPQVLMSNGGYPCLHTGPGPLLGLENQKTAYRRGIVYFMENNKDALLQRYERDRFIWAKWPKRP